MFNQKETTLLFVDTVANPRHPNKKQPRRSDENIVAVRTSIDSSSRKSDPRLSAQLDHPTEHNSF